MFLYGKFVNVSVCVPRSRAEAGGALQDQPARAAASGVPGAGRPGDGPPPAWEQSPAALPPPGAAGLEGATACPLPSLCTCVRACMHAWTQPVHKLWCSPSQSLFFVGYISCAWLSSVSRVFAKWVVCTHVHTHTHLWWTTCVCFVVVLIGELYVRDVGWARYLCFYLRSRRNVSSLWGTVLCCKCLFESLWRQIVFSQYDWKHDTVDCGWWLGFLVVLLSLLLLLF